MNASRSFYFFDFDKNIMKVKVPLVLTNTEDGSTKEVSSGQYYTDIKDKLGKEPPWKDWSDKDLFLNYRDRPDTPASRQPFVTQIETTIDGVDAKEWQAPAWGVFVHACNTGRPFSLITARGHADDTVRAGFEVLKERGYIEQTPNYLTIYNVTYPPTLALLDPKGKIVDQDGKPDTPGLKYQAILRSVDVAVAKYGAARHRFGMSDDTEENVEFIADAMVKCKERYGSMRFFVISTNSQHNLKAEIFPMNVPVTGHGDPAGMDPLESHLDD